MRHALGSIDLADLEDEPPATPEQRKAYCARIAAVWPVIEKDMKRLMHEQLMFSSQQAATWEQAIMGRGTFNGADLLYEKWLAAFNEHMNETKKPEEFDKTNPLPEI